MPADANIAVAAATAAPALAFAGSWLGVRGSRRGAVELDRWRRREETMRLMRWAAELAADSDVRRSVVGIAALDGLLGSELLQHEDLNLVLAVANTFVAAPVVQYDYDVQSGEVDDVVYTEESRDVSA